MFKRLLIAAALLTVVLQTQGQAWWQQADTLKKPRLILAATSQAVTYTATLGGLYTLWYAAYDQEPFHFFDDTHTWMQMDKVGHTATSYQIADGLYRINRWTGASAGPSLRWAVIEGYSYQLAIEVFDGFSAGWGFSWADQIANTLGTGTFLAQQLAWNEQRIRWKYSFWPSGLTRGNSLEADRARALYGTSITEQWLKDYNGQTYWMSVNVWSMIGKPEGRFPKWLCVALGYSVNNVLGASSNSWTIDNDTPEEVRYSSDLKRERQFLLSLDVDLYKANLPKPLEFIKPIFGVVKFPFPSIGINTRNGLEYHWLYF